MPVVDARVRAGSRLATSQQAKRIRNPDPHRRTDAVKGMPRKRCFRLKHRIKAPYALFTAMHWAAHKQIP